MADIAMRYHVAIVGGGMVGAALATGLAMQGFRVLVLEARPPQLEWPADQFDLRVSAITRASQHIFNNLAVWSAMVAQRATPYARMCVWESAGYGEVEFSAADIGACDLGHIIENRIIQGALWRRMQEVGVEVLTAVELGAVGHAEDGCELHLADGRCVQADLLVGADGGASRVRELALIGVRGHAYDQQAVVASVHCELGNQATAWQRFMPTGPLALLPLGREHVSIVWSTTPQQAQALRTVAVDAFDDALTRTSGGRLGQLTLVGERAVFPLRAQHATRYVLPGLALVGDAAHVIHPLAGQGVNLGLLDAAQLLDELVAARAQGYPLGALRVLRRYERARKGHNIAMQTAMDGFKYLYGNDLAPLRLARNVGMAAVGRIGPARRLCERIALGATTDLPFLARGPAQ